MILDYVVRKPTQKELDMLAECIIGMDRFECLFDRTVPMIEDGIKAIENAHVIVMENYTPDSPSYYGTVFTVYWGECCFCDSFVYNTDKTEIIWNEFD